MRITREARRTLLRAAAALVTSAVSAVPAVSRAQTATYYVVTGSDTVSVERVTRGVARLEGELVLRAQGSRVAYAATLGANETMTAMETWLRRGADTTTLQHARITLTADSAIAEVGSTVQRIGTPPGAMPYINPSAGLLDQALRRARALGGASAEVPLIQGGMGMITPLHVTWLGADSAVLSIAGTEMRASISGSTFTGAVVPSQSVRFVRVEGARTLDAAPLPPPDYRAPAGAPYVAEEVRIVTTDGVKLAGTLTLPRRGAPPTRVPAVVLITGSGTQARDEAIPIVAGYRPFRQIADTLSRRGIAVLRLDDRGAGASDPGPRGATSADFATDIGAALAYLRARPEIDDAKLGLVGHSEGGLIAPLVAAHDTALKAIVLMAGPSQTGRAIISYQQRYAIESMSRVAPGRRDSAYAASMRTVDSLAKENGWMRFFLDYDPLPTAQRVRQPVLILQGATDRQVTQEQAQALAAAFRAGGNRDVTVRVFPATNHLFLPDSSGNPSGYAKLADTRVRATVLGTLADWLVQRLR